MVDLKKDVLMMGKNGELGIIRQGCRSRRNPWGYPFLLLFLPGTSYATLSQAKTRAWPRQLQPHERHDQGISFKGNSTLVWNGIISNQQSPSAVHRMIRECGIKIEARTGPVRILILVLVLVLVLVRVQIRVPGLHAFGTIWLICLRRCLSLAAVVTGEGMVMV